MAVGFGVAILFFGLNYPWTHAALARLAGASPCPYALQTNAREAASALFGDAVSSPVFLCMDQPVLGLAISHGTTRFAPMLPAIVVLGPQGQNGDVAAHEFAHAELAERTSVLLRTYRIPTWFDEGLAMQLDHRDDYSASALRRYLNDDSIPPMTLQHLDRPASFYRPGREGKAPYAFARCVVGRWLDDAGSDGLRDVIAGTGWFRPFPASAFENAEAACLLT